MMAFRPSVTPWPWRATRRCGSRWSSRTCRHRRSAEGSLSQRSCNDHPLCAAAACLSRCAPHSPGPAMLVELAVAFRPVDGSDGLPMMSSGGIAEDFDEVLVDGRDAPVGMCDADDGVFVQRLFAQVDGKVARRDHPFAAAFGFAKDRLTTVTSATNAAIRMNRRTGSPTCQVQRSSAPRRSATRQDERDRHVAEHQRQTGKALHLQHRNSQTRRRHRAPETLENAARLREIQAAIRHKPQDVLTLFTN
jgi:hypothetical protein